MGVISRFFRREPDNRTEIKPFDVRSTATFPESRLDLPEDWLLRSFGMLSGGVSVNADTAMTVSAVYACVRILAESIASFPLKLYQKQDRKRMEVVDSPLNHLVKAEPNEYQTSFEFREMLQGHVGLRGNAYAVITRNGMGEPVKLDPVHPAKVRVERINGKIIYSVDGQIYDWSDILHLRGLSSDGICGLSPIAMLRDTVGLALSEQKHGLNTYQNGAKPGGILETPMNLTDDQIARLREQWEKHQGGTANSGSTAILQGGMTWKSVGFNNSDSQFLESRKFSVEEIARAYRIPLHLLQSTEKSTSWGSGIEQQNIGFVIYTLMPWLCRWEQALNRVLLTEEQKFDGYYFKFSLDNLLRGDFKTRQEGYKVGVEGGWLSRNEVRAMEDMNPIEDGSGDDYYRPLNTVKADELSQEAKQEEEQPQPEEVEA